ncbi:hypothetical protein C8R43DRAFT_1240351 [Mycena crocata]|nr:hypothetical protein C8R43DRAFT_1240351 [Mycena crocata]
MSAVQRLEDKSEKRAYEDENDDEDAFEDEAVVAGAKPNGGMDGALPNSSHWAAALACFNGCLKSIGLAKFIPDDILSTDGKFVLPSAVESGRSELQQAADIDNGLIKDIHLRFIRRTKSELLTEWRRRKDSWPALAQNDEDLKIWASAYQEKAGEASKENIKKVAAFLVAFELEEKIERVLGSPTLKRTLAAFNRDLATIDHNSINLLWPRIQQELNLYDDHVASFAPIPASKPKDAPRIKTVAPKQSSTKAQTAPSLRSVQIPCSGCHRSFQSNDVGSIKKHWEEVHPNMQPKCKLCTSSKGKRTFKLDGLIAHTVTMHPDSGT